MVLFWQTYLVSEVCRSCNSGYTKTNFGSVQCHMNKSGKYILGLEACLEIPSGEVVRLSTVPPVKILIRRRKPGAGDLYGQEPLGRGSTNLATGRSGHEVASCRANWIGSMGGLARVDKVSVRL